MKTIYKYPIEVTDEQYISTHEGAKILTVQDQNGKLTIWAEVDTSKMKINKKIAVVGTGNPAPDNLNTHYRYIDTVQMGMFVWHVYEHI